MEMPDLNHTLLLTIAVLVSLTRLVRLMFFALRVCVKEYCEFRNWLRAYLRRVARDHHSFERRVGRVRDHAGDDRSAGDGDTDVRGQHHGDGDGQSTQHVTPDAARLTPTAARR